MTAPSNVTQFAAARHRAPFTPVTLRGVSWLLLACLVLLVLPAQVRAQFGGAGGPAQVGVVTLEQSLVPYTVTLPGRAVAHDDTEVRPRVEGIIEEIAYRPGTRVAAGDVLFRLETDTYDLALLAAEAQRASARSAVAVAQSTVDRYNKLTSAAISQADRDGADATLASAQATLAAAEASLKSAQLNLDRTVIRSPIDGIVGLSDYSVGALVTANQSDPLTTVTRVDPIYVDVQESSARMLRNRARMESGALQPSDKVEIRLVLETGRIYEGTGTLVTPSTAVSTTTGTVDFRFEFDNPDRLLMPGQFLRVTAEVGKIEAILVPQRATSRSSDGTLTAFVAEDGTARQVTLTTQGAYQNAWIVTAGVEDGQRLVVDGLRNLAAGAQIAPVPVTIDADGIVRDAAQDAPESAGD
ncbi:efflux RND transporter periplasmic adaptor subunit [Pseudooceanicola sp. HF7]|uniref:efflux RND transporter periplasmic adaptor subunit n=1 Tax=Pseudooceanicola sp. HF7 TaxID=2721560 RepID=UPI00142FC557|nr:efflux RND transporter periplasmic adaptor subunit [Pseudooceanicola sp. HF7]NIZ10891.1 efflux RND transporter periplasmic adaptor subunit [Pseudooceanicola sp. HF7]